MCGLHVELQDNCMGYVEKFINGLFLWIKTYENRKFPRTSMYILPHRIWIKYEEEFTE